MSLHKICEYHVPFMGGTCYVSENAIYGLVADTNVVESGSAVGPTCCEVDGGGVAIAMSALPTNATNVVQLCNGDVLPFPVQSVERVWFEMKATGLTAATTVLVGVCGSTYDVAVRSQIQTAAWLIAVGGTAVKAEVRDGVNNLAVLTDVTLSGSVYQLCCIDFTKGVNDVRFNMDDTSRALRRQCTGNAFSVSAASTQNVQFVARVEKASSADLPILYVRNLCVEYRSN